MTIMPVAERMTAAKFLALPVPERGRPWNLVDGDVVVNEPTRLHAGALGALHLALGSWTQGEEAARGEASDIAVEVRSPATWRYDIGERKAGYERHGLTELWLLDTAAEVVLVFRRSQPNAAAFDVALEVGGAEELTSPLLPGFAPAVQSLFSR